MSAFPRERKGEQLPQPCGAVQRGEVRESERTFYCLFSREKPAPEKGAIIYTPFGINNQWGACPTLDDEQTLDVLRLLEKWQKKGVRFDYFTLDTGWVATGSDLSVALALQPAAPEEHMAVRFADADRLSNPRVYACETRLPAPGSEPTILAVVIRLRQGGNEWRYSPGVVAIVQAVARVGDQNVSLIPVPDGRQYGNTQEAGCSWVVYKTRLSPQWSHQSLKLAVHACLPDKVDVPIEARAGDGGRKTRVP